LERVCEDLCALQQAQPAFQEIETFVQTQTDKRLRNLNQQLFGQINAQTSVLEHVHKEWSSICADVLVLQHRYAPLERHLLLLAN